MSAPATFIYHDLLNIYEPTTILGWEQLGKSQEDLGNAPLLEGWASDLFVAIFKQNISKQSKG